MEETEGSQGGILRNECTPLLGRKTGGEVITTDRVRVKKLHDTIKT